MVIQVSRYEWRPGRYQIVYGGHHEDVESYIFDHCMEVFDKPCVNDSQQNRNILEAMINAHNGTVEWMKPLSKRK